MSRVVVLDMAGTTVSDDGSVEHAFMAAFDDVVPGADAQEQSRAMGIVHQTMGQSKIDVFRLVLGDEPRARRALEVFERAYLAEIGAGRVRAVDGAEAVLQQLRNQGHGVCLTTGFPPRIRDRLVDWLGWSTRVDLALSPVDAGRGRPYPDMVLTAFLRLGGEDVAELVVVGDTPSDMLSGRRAGAATRVGVLTGGSTPEQLRAAGATLVSQSVVGLGP